MQRIQKTISDVAMEGDVPSLLPGHTVAKAIDLMRERGTDGVLILRDGALVGIFTGRDFVHRVAGENRDPATTILADVMTPSPDSLRVTDCVTYAINRMAFRGFRNVPIVDDQARPVALVSAHDIIEHLAEVLAELARPVDQTGAAAKWVDIGGGG